MSKAEDVGAAITNPAQGSGWSGDGEVAGCESDTTGSSDAVVATARGVAGSRADP